VLFIADKIDLTPATRLALALLVDREAHRTGSRVAAYTTVADLVGTSSSWVQKFLRDTGEVRGPRVPLFLRIRAAYNEFCERIEHQNELDEIRLRNLKGRLDALAEGTVSQSYPHSKTVPEADWLCRQIINAGKCPH